MNRRSFIKVTTTAGIAMAMPGFSMDNSKTHILTLSFDDGFKKSFYKTAEIHEEYGLKACLNIIASVHFGENKGPAEYHSDTVGNFEDWNLLKKRGHEIMPHTWAHNNLTEMPFSQATELIDKCLDYFGKNLDGFKASESVFNFSYNASTPELEDYVLSKVWALRTGGWNILGDKMANPFPDEHGPLRLGCWSFGPENADDWTESEINKFLKTEGGWLVLNLHGLDKEGWGPLSTSYLDNLLKRLVKIDYLDVLPTGEVLKMYVNK